jgi:hypothetical protein
MFPHVEPLPSHASSPNRTIFQLNSIHTNMVSPNMPHKTHFQCEPIFNNTFGEIPFWIDPSTTLRIATHNVQGIKPFKDEAKLQG